MSKQTNKQTWSRRLTKWHLHLPLGWRIVAALFALFGLLAAVRGGIWLTRQVIEKISSDDYRCTRSMGNGYNHRLYYGKEYAIGYRDKRKPVLHHVDWVAGSCDDSLWVVSRAGRRAYFNTKSGQLVMPFTYRHAWLFSEGVAAVVDTVGRITFIGPDGRQAIPFWFAYDTLRRTDYQFHNGLCPMYVPAGDAGLIDRSGRWVLREQYDSVEFESGYWALHRGDSLAVADSAGRIVVGMTPGHKLTVTEDGDLELWHRTRPARLYSPDGRLLAAQVYWSIGSLYYYENDSYTGIPTGLLVYSTCFDHTGLVDADGRILTDAIYTDIDAVSPSLFRAEFHDVPSDCGSYSTAYVLLNNKGQIMPR